MKIAVSIPDDLFENAERATKRLGVTRSRLYQQALTEFLDKRNEHAVTEALNAVYGSAQREELVDPLLAHLQSASIPREEW